MPNPNAIVAAVLRLEGDFVHLGNQRRVRVDPERPGTGGYFGVLEGLRQLRRPVYLEVDPQTSAITRLLIPTVSRVKNLSLGDDGLEVELDNSHALHTVPSKTADAEEMEQTLREALHDGRVLIITEDDDHNIIDVRAFRPGPDGELPPLPPFPEPRLPKWPWALPRLIDIWRWKWWPWWWFCCVSSTRAQQIFDAMAVTTCNPLTVPPPCIPFMYPDDGCWGRAHEMCRLMLTMGITPAKVWIDKSGPLLHADTRNNPQCFVEWYWHVAPTICVRRWRWCCFLWARDMVIDPSLFTTPVTKAQWKAVQNNPNATLTDTSWTQFWKSGGTDPTFSASDGVLADHRMKLQVRSLTSVGPPPYANCP